MSKPERVRGLVEWEEVTGWVARQDRLDDLVHRNMEGIKHCMLQVTIGPLGDK